MLEPHTLLTPTHAPYLRVQLLSHLYNPVLSKNKPHSFISTLKLWTENPQIAMKIPNQIFAEKQLPFAFSEFCHAFLPAISVQAPIEKVLRLAPGPLVAVSKWVASARLAQLPAAAKRAPCNGVMVSLMGRLLVTCGSYMLQVLQTSRRRTQSQW